MGHKDSYAPAGHRKAPRMAHTAIRHVVWDWNGTLLNDADACVAAVDALMRRRGLGGETREGYRARVRFPVRSYYVEVGFDLEKEAYGDVCDEFGEAYEMAVAGKTPAGTVHSRLSHGTVHPDVPDVLTALAHAGVTHAIVSASEETALARQVSQYALSRHFTALTGRADNHAGTKDHLVRHWVDHCGYARDQILYVGDTEHDAEAAAAAGIRAVLVSDGHVTAERLRRTGVPVFPNRAALWQALDGMTRQPAYRELTFGTILGDMRVVTDNLGLVHVGLPGAVPWPLPADGRREAPDDATHAAAAAILQWLACPRETPPVPASIFGSEFRRAVWQAVREIPFGSTVSYGGLALRMGKPGAARAIAQALRDNPVPLVVPCHRVVGADGSPVGFMGVRQNPLQHRLLELEQTGVCNGGDDTIHHGGTIR